MSLYEAAWDGIFLIVCVSINQELCYGSLIYGLTVFASPPISNYSFSPVQGDKAILRRTIYRWFAGIYWDKQLILIVLRKKNMNNTLDTIFSWILFSHLEWKGLGLSYP